MEDKREVKMRSPLKEARILFQILAMVRQKPPNKSIHRKDIAEEVNISIRSVQRYTNTLAEMGLMVYEKDLQTYVATERGHAFPQPVFTPEEAFALTLSVQLLGKTPSTFGHDLQRAVGKMASQLPSRLQTLAKEVTQEIKSTARPFVGGDARLMALLEAARERRVVRMDYTSARRGREWRTIHPYGFDVDGSRWWVHGWCVQNAMIRTFALENLHDLKVSEDEKFERDEDAWAEFRHQPGVFHQIRGERPVEVEAIFAPEVARYALRTPWPDGFSLQTRPDGSVQLRGTAQGVEGIVPELLRWRRFVRVTGGSALVEAMQGELQAMAALYKDFLEKPGSSATQAGTPLLIETR